MRKHEGVRATGKTNSLELTLQTRKRGLLKAGEEIWMMTDENGENKKEGQGKTDDGSHMVQDFLWYRHQTSKEN